MNMETFASTVRTQLADMLQKEVILTPVLKLNGIRLHGITIPEANGANISPIVYLEPFFECFMSTGDLEKTMGEILELCRNYNQPVPFDTGQLLDFGRVKERLHHRLVNYEANKELLRTVPHRRFLDLAKIYYADCVVEASEKERIPGSVLIRKKHLESWGISDSELERAADTNTPRLCPVLFHPAHEISTGEIMQDPDIHEETLPDRQFPLYYLSNMQKKHGASVICYPGVLKDLSRQFGGDLIILPSSVHEALLIPQDAGLPIDLLKAMVHEINREEVAPSDFLSDNVYIFSKQENQLRIA